MDNILANLVRVGIVTDADKDRHMCRVKYPDTGITSGWLYVLQRYDEDVHLEPDQGHTHDVNYAGDHTHGVTTNGAHTHTVSEVGGHTHTGTAGDEEVSLDSAGDHSHSTESAGDHSHSTITAGGHTHTTSTGWYGPDRRGWHDHSRSYVTWWIPRINDRVLVLYVPTENGDGFVLGGIF